MAGSFPVEKDCNSHEIPLKAERQSMTFVLPAQKTQLQQAYNVGVQCGLVHVATPCRQYTSHPQVLARNGQKIGRALSFLPEMSMRNIALLDHFSSLAVQEMVYS